MQDVIRHDFYRVVSDKLSLYLLRFNLTNFYSVLSYFVTCDKRMRSLTAILAHYSKTMRWNATKIFESVQHNMATHSASQ